MQLNEDKLKAAEIFKVQKLFSKDNVVSYGAAVKSRLGFASISPGTVAGTDTEKDERGRATFYLILPYKFHENCNYNRTETRYQSA